LTARPRKPRSNGAWKGQDRTDADEVQELASGLGRLLALLLRLHADAVNQDVLARAGHVLPVDDLEALGRQHAAVGAHRHAADGNEAVLRHVEAAGLDIDHHPSLRCAVVAAHETQALEQTEHVRP
jgi:hypothetical protein